MARSSGRESSRTASKSRYEYKQRTADTYKKRGDQQSSQFDTYIKDTVKLYKPRDADNCIRVLPPTWDEAEHFGIDLYVHFNIGPDNQAYLCLEHHGDSACPICEERAQAQRKGDTEYADKLKATKRVAIWMIDRNDEKEGPMIWTMPWTIDRDLCKLVVDKRTGEILPIDHPEEGYDIEFERKGKAMKTEYIGLAVARRPSELGDDAWLEYIEENPLPTMLNVYSYDHIQKVFLGSPKPEEGDDGHEEKPARRSSKPAPKKETETWESIHSMSYEEMCAYIEDTGLKIEPEESKDDDDLADWICEEASIIKAAKAARRPAKAEPEDDAEDTPVSSKLKNMRNRR